MAVLALSLGIINLIGLGVLVFRIEHKMKSHRLISNGVIHRHLKTRKSL